MTATPTCKGNPPVTDRGWKRGTGCTEEGKSTSCNGKEIISWNGRWGCLQKGKELWACGGSSHPEDWCSGGHQSSETPTVAGRRCKETAEQWQDRRPRNQERDLCKFCKALKWRGDSVKDLVFLAMNGKIAILGVPEPSWHLKELFSGQPVAQSAEAQAAPGWPASCVISLKTLITYSFFWILVSLERFSNTSLLSVHPHRHHILPRRWVWLLQSLCTSNWSLTMHLYVAIEKAKLKLLWWKMIKGFYIFWQTVENLCLVAVLPPSPFSKFNLVWWQLPTPSLFQAHRDVTNFL